MHGRPEVDAARVAQLRDTLPVHRRRLPLGLGGKDTRRLPFPVEVSLPLGEIGGLLFVAVGEQQLLPLLDGPYDDQRQRLSLEPYLGEDDVGRHRRHVLGLPVARFVEAHAPVDSRHAGKEQRVAPVCRVDVLDRSRAAPPQALHLRRVERLVAVQRHYLAHLVEVLLGAD